MLNSLQPDRHLLSREHVSLAANCQGTFEVFEQFLESERVCETMTDTGVDIVLALPLNLWRIRASQSGDKGQELLALLVSGHIIQIHGEAANRAREAVRHVMDGTDRPVEEASRDNGRFVDAGSPVPARERV